MSLAEKYLKGLKDAYIREDAEEELEQLKFSQGINNEDLDLLLKTYPECPQTLIDLLKMIDGTYFRKYGDKTVLLYLLGSDVEEYPYYLLSGNQIVTNADELNIDYFREICEDDRISTAPIEEIKWLHFSDCMNNGGTSQLLIDFTPSDKGVKGQILRFLHDPDKFVVIANSFDEYLENLIEYEYDFISDYLFD